MLGDAVVAGLVETGEIGARSYVDRMRATADAWLGSAGLSIRLSLGWASPAAVQPSSVSLWLANQRNGPEGQLSGFETKEWSQHADPN